MLYKTNMQHFGMCPGLLWQRIRRGLHLLSRHRLGLTLALGLQAAFAQVNHIESAARLLSQGELGQAETEARLALKTPGTRALAFAMLGTIRLQQDKYPESVTFLGQALALNPNLVGARTTLGEAYVIQGKTDQARQAFREALQRDPGNFNARFDWARLESSQRNFKRSLELANPILSQLSGTEEGLLLLATDYAALEKKNELALLPEKWQQLSAPSENGSIDFAGLLVVHGIPAPAKDILDATETKIAEHPTAPLALRLGQAYLSLGDLDRAEKNSMLALSVDPACTACDLTLAQIAEQQGITEKALSYLVQARKLSPDDPEVLFQFGKVCLMRNLVEDALPALAKAVELQPDRDLYVYVLASANVQKGDLPKAASLIGELLKKHPRDATFNYGIGTVYFLQAKYPEAESSFKTSLAIQPDQIPAAYYLALTYDALAEEDKAVPILRDITKKHPDHALSLEKLGTILSREEHYTEAEQCLRRAISLDPTSAGAHYRLGVVLKQLGKITESEEQFAESRKLQADLEAQRHVHLRLLLPE